MGDYHTVACDHAGAAFAWGENTAGQLGRGEIGSRNVGVLNQPTVIAFGRGDEKNNKGRPQQRYLGEFSDRQLRTEANDFKPAFRNRRFVFDVAAGGWQSGALVVDMRDYCTTGDEASSRRRSREDATTADSISAQDPNAEVAEREIPKGEQTGAFSSDSANRSVTENEATEAGRTSPGLSRDSREGLYHQDHGDEQNSASGVPLRRGGLPFIRFGFAARGGLRGNGGSDIPRQ